MKKIYITALLVFLLCSVLGFWLASRKPLWTDEVFTQVNVVDRYSFREILTLHKDEGNLCPLFYVIQNTICDVFQYRFPLKWKGEFAVFEPQGQRILRLAPNLYMSLAIVLLFVFFARYYSYGAGLLSYVITLSSFMVWYYWVEARPYGLWFLLTSVQMILFLQLWQRPKQQLFPWIGFTLVNIFLSLTIVVSGVQILIFSFLLLWRYRNFRKFLVYCLLPVAVCFYYYIRSKEVYGWLKPEPFSNFTLANLLEGKKVMPQEHLKIVLFRNISSSWLVFLLGYWIYLFVAMRRRAKLCCCVNTMESKSIAGISTSILVLLVFVSLVMMLVFASWEFLHKWNFSFSERIFIFLVPIASVASTAVSIDFYRRFKEDLWLKNCVVLVVGGLIVFNALQTFLKIWGYGFY